MDSLSPSPLHPPLHPPLLFPLTLSLSSLMLTLFRSSAPYSLLLLKRGDNSSEIRQKLLLKFFLPLVLFDFNLSFSSPGCASLRG
jgi:hypothetical protein